MNDAVCHVPLTVQQIRSLVEGREDPAATDARRKLAIWAQASRKVGVWVRVDQFWRRPRRDGKQFGVAGFATSAGNGGFAVVTYPMTPGGRGSVRQLRGFSLNLADPTSGDLLLRTPAPARLAVSTDTPLHPSRTGAVIELLGARLRGMRPLGDVLRGGACLHADLEIDADETVIAELDAVSGVSWTAL